MIKKLLSLWLLLCFCSSQFALAQEVKNYNKLVRKTEKRLTKEAKKHHSKQQSENKQATPDLYWIQQFIATMNPSLGKPTPEVLMEALQELNKQEQTLYSAMPGTTNTPWTERGPNNIGGRTRALAWDPWDATGKKVWAGGITGGLWYNTDITNTNSSWQHVSALWSNLSISAIGFDPVNSGVMYVGTGEGYGSNSSISRGYGMWRSADSGKTFNWLANSATFYYVNDIIVRNESGSAVVYAAVDANYHAGSFQGLSSYGILRSTNNGTSWTNVIGNAANGAKYAIADMELDANNNLWAGTRLNGYSGSDRGGGRVLYSTNGTSWSVKYTLGKEGRVELACAPGNANIVYAAFENSQKLDTMLVTHNGGSKWTVMAKPDDADLGISKWDFSRGQAWYDLILAVDPNDTNTVVAGGIDLFRSTNGGSSWSQISKWSNNANLNTLNCSYVHADQHQIAFKKGSSSTCLFGTDGGVFYTSNLASAASSNVIAERNKNYITSQFYWADMAGGSGSNTLLGGMQDNGTIKITASGTAAGTEVTGGDGAACFISASNSNKQISSYVYNNYYYTTNNWTASGNLISDGATGKFINAAEWDEAGSGLFTAKAQGAIYRIKLTSGPGTLQTVTWTASGVPSTLDAFPLSGSKTRLFVGTDAGKLYVTQDAWATSPTFSNITGTINAGNITDVYNLRSGDTIAVTISNYGLNKIYVSTNGGSSWSVKDGNLGNIPVWSIILNPNKIGEAVIATELGVYGTSDIYASNPVWTAYQQGMGAVKTATLRYRSSDKMLLAATHGRGLFISDAWAKNNPIAYFGASAVDICSNQTLQLKDSSLNNPTQWEWNVSPAGYKFINSDSTSQNPTLAFTKGGVYTVKLTATNQLGANAFTRSSFFKVTDTIAGAATLTANKDTICTGDSITFTANVASALTGSITSYSWKLGSNTVNNSLNQMKLATTAGETFNVTLVSNKKCVSPPTFKTNTLSPVVLPNITPTLGVNAPTGCAGSPLNVVASGTNLGTSPSYSWYLDNVVQTGNAATLTVSNPTNGAEVYAQVFVPGKCILPQNLITSSKIALNVNPKPATPTITLSWDTLYVSNVGAGTYTWYRNGTAVGTGNIKKLTQHGGYRCVLTNNGCSSDSSNLVTFNSLAVDEMSAKNARLYPVPAGQYLYLELHAPISEVSIYNAAGQQMITGWKQKSTQWNPNSQTETVQMDLGGLAAGSYVLKYTVQGASMQQAFIKE
ncbi:MAG: T9SS type A sorting domain-containing protein [Bacteroidia bacterium]|nr:T9SS type A sorting domain-containing protein [Bacteroidia bacterium]